MSKLFDDNDEQEEKDPNQPNRKDEEEDDEEFIPTKIISHDKIFGNDYNTGNLDFEEYDLPRVDVFYAEDNLQDCYDAFEYNRKIKLETLVDTYFNETEFGKIFANKKKIPKQILPNVFVAIRQKFMNSEYTGSEIFISIADYFGMSYDVLYENIPSIYREQLVRELDEKYGVLRKKGVKRLF